ncbi:hypothetical protein TNCV_1653371 [Trichonephila clavipes]|nr:hypothetical protein TNCV_1653371 [Trichonephila clavipes]
MTLILQKPALKGGIVLPKRRLCCGSFAEISVFKAVMKRPTLSSRGITNMIRKFEATGTLGIQPGRGRKCVAAQVVEENRSQTIDSTRVRRIAAFIEQPHFTVHKLL